MNVNIDALNDMDVLKYIEVNQKSRKPKYQQIVDSIIHHISIGNLSMDQKIPSINQLSEEFYLSRDTVEKAYNILKQRKIISSIKGKGFYITQTKLISEINILFLINKLSSYKMRIYNSFVNSIGGNIHTDLHIYHCDETLFLNLIDKNLGAYDYYVIMPHFKTKDLNYVSFTDEVVQAIEKIPKEKLVIMDNNKLGNNGYGIEGQIIEIYQDFENDIYNALKQGLTKISKYKKLVLAYPENAQYPYPRRIMRGFRKFCIEQSIDFEILEQIYDDMILEPGDLFITIEESDLVSLVKQLRDKNLIIGTDIGVISYNDTPLKELLGITVISTDFKIMGETVAQMILNNQKGKLKNPFNFIDRNSL